MEAVKIKNLNYSIKNQPILQNINFELKKDTIACILGPSGSGKTTLLKLIAGLERVQSGSITINDNEVSSLTHHLPTEKRKVGFLFQDYALFPHLTVKQNLEYPINFKNSAHTIEDMAELIKLPNSLNKYPHELSGGEQQRVALARSIISNPDLLLLDEPFSSLDLNLREEVRDDTLHLLQKSNVSVIIVTHDPFEAMFISNQINIMDTSGHIIQTGTAEELYNNPNNSYVTEFFGETNKFEGIVNNSFVDTPLGKIKAPNNLENKKVEVHIRPKGIKLNEQPTPVNGIKGTVMASKLIGSFSFIHLSVLDKNNEVIHIHSHMPPDFNPQQSSAVEIEIDQSETFMFQS
ncbi:MAG: Fe(3+) ions import ATP-binding protein FbpC [Alphaproteobacteria bacterium MarineAlpha5_Bin5]|nr:MAG: Fe(3+) ions import ATP-binding protein FbpC [Alphaproteobacteria bacterium MarineAlpha5_Bin5]|tara:strand:+ start:1718 stop:2764 length:1047 start_codon:yes stop_codon:yes gene_type:complete